MHHTLRLFSLAAMLLLAAPLQATRILLYGESFMMPLTQAFDQAGIPYERLERGPLTGRDAAQVDVLFLAHDRSADPAVLAWVEAFVDQGGKLFTFFVLPPSLQQRLGVRLGTYLQPESGAFSQFRTDPSIPHLPAIVRQRSWNINQAFPAADSVQVIATWNDQEGRDTGHAALLLSPRGAHLTHVLLDHDVPGATHLYLALLGHFFPQLWPAAVHHALQAADLVGGGEDSLAVLAQTSHAARRSLGRAADARRQSVELLHEGDYGKALHAALQTRQLKIRALAQTQPSRPGEFRAVWLHSPYGVADWGWEETCRLLARQGFNAIVPNMLDAGLASYPTQLLPVDRRVGERGDQLAAAVAAARRHGLAFHAWKVNYNLHTADSAFVDRMRREGRLQRDLDGQELAWLCPSHPDNIALELASLLEVVRHYPVDGLHLDYIRYPHSRACYCQGCRQRFEQQTGHRIMAWPEEAVTGELSEPFQRWRREQITRLVRAVSVQARRIRPEVQISAAVFPDGPQTRFSIGQDWIDWVEAGYLDFVCPMNYLPEMDAFRRMVQRQVDWVGGRVPLYIGIGAFRLSAATDKLLEQLAWTRQAGADGFILFQYDPRLGEEILPLLRQGITARDTHPPHTGPHVAFELSGKSIRGMDWGEEFYAAGDSVSLRVQLVEGIQARSSSGSLTLRLLGDRTMQQLGDLDSRRQTERSTILRLPPGDYRPVVEGRYRDAQGKRQHFTRRGPVLRFRSWAFLDSLEQRYGPPTIPSTGIPVGVTIDGYGGAALLQMLKDQTGLAAFPVHYITPAVLKATRVLVVPQPRQRSRFDQATRLALRAWVAEGGRLLVTHDLVGIRGLLPIIPEVCARGIGFPASNQWQTVADHPAVAGLPAGLQTHAYYDHIVLEPGAAGTVLAVDEKDRPVLVVGPHGRGRYAALGLAPGLGPGDREVAPAGAERRLVESLVGWLTEGVELRERTETARPEAGR